MRGNSAGLGGLMTPKNVHSPRFNRQPYDVMCITAPSAAGG